MTQSVGAGEDPIRSDPLAPRRSSLLHLSIMATCAQPSPPAAHGSVGVRPLVSGGAERAHV